MFGPCGVLGPGGVIPAFVPGVLAFMSRGSASISTQSHIIYTIVEVVVKIVF